MWKLQKAAVILFLLGLSVLCTILLPSFQQDYPERYYNPSSNEVKYIPYPQSAWTLTEEYSYQLSGLVACTQVYPSATTKGSPLVYEAKWGHCESGWRMLNIVALEINVLFWIVILSGIYFVAKRIFRKN